MSNIDRSVGAAVSRIVKAEPGRLESYSCMNLNADIRYFQLFNATALPTAGAVPLESWPVLPNGGLLIIDELFLGKFGINYGTGIVWGFSTTPRTYTAGAAADAIVVVRFD